MGKMNKFAFKNYSPIFTAFFERRAVFGGGFEVRFLRGIGEGAEKRKSPENYEAKIMCFLQLQKILSHVDNLHRNHR